MRIRTILASAALLAAVAGGSASAAQKSENLQVAQMTMQHDGMTTEQVRMTKHQRMMWWKKHQRMMAMKHHQMMMMHKKQPMMMQKSM